jgi:putative nucleotidyltransferase with HDIG domain
MSSVIQAMSATVEKRDPYTAGHQKRAASLAASIASEMNLSEDEIKAIEMAGLIHDIGKISIPAGILSKPGQLNTAEFELIRSHPNVAYEILREIDLPWPVDKIVLQHHERMDGSGYPLGLTGDETLQGARILAVADVVETMASHRPYRAGLGLDKAISEVKENRGALFDPMAVDACISLFEENRFQF